MHNREGKDNRENSKQLTSCTAEEEEDSRRGLQCHFLCSLACLKCCMITKEKERIIEKKSIFCWDWATG